MKPWASLGLRVAFQVVLGGALPKMVVSSRHEIWTHSLQVVHQREEGEVMHTACGLCGPCWMSIVDRASGVDTPTHSP